jgi:hypothetical protein
VIKPLLACPLPQLRRPASKQLPSGSAIAFRCCLGAVVGPRPGWSSSSSDTVFLVTVDGRPDREWTRLRAASTFRDVKPVIYNEHALRAFACQRGLSAVGCMNCTRLTLFRISLSIGDERITQTAVVKPQSTIGNFIITAFDFNDLRDLHTTPRSSRSNLPLMKSVY